ncbi:hypothetical protein BDFB_014024 [Asbolus verrucosus]|uniref:Uncharacterized protein n=1 Tax=Asbolus verrucosus TaxID=1661398 RepID=A0A482VUV1_ASBVE|nr:hypothetical protein BDFB_014024 [Asbolus verrucosus]
MTTDISTSKQLKERIIDAFLNGERQAANSRHFAIPRYTVCRVLKLHQEREHLEHMPKCERPLENCTKNKSTRSVERRLGEG